MLRPTQTQDSTQPAQSQCPGLLLLHVSLGPINAGLSLDHACCIARVTAAFGVVGWLSMPAAADAANARCRATTKEMK